VALTCSGLTAFATELQVPLGLGACSRLKPGAFHVMMASAPESAILSFGRHSKLARTFAPKTMSELVVED
jgi:hypothetical protein